MLLKQQEKEPEARESGSLHFMCLCSSGMFLNSKSNAVSVFNGFVLCDNVVKNLKLRKSWFISYSMNHQIRPEAQIHLWILVRSESIKWYLLLQKHFELIILPSFLFCFKLTKRCLVWCKSLNIESVKLFLAYVTISICAASKYKQCRSYWLLVLIPKQLPCA